MAKENVEANKESPDLFEDDDYLAYSDQLTEQVQRIAERDNDPAAWRALVYSRYNGDSVFGNWIAAHRQCLPYLLEQLHSHYEVRRMYSVYVLASMLAKSKTSDPFPTAKYQALKGDIRRLAMQDAVAVRFSAVQGLGLIKDPEDADFISKLSARITDPFLKKEALQIAQAIRDVNHKSTQ
jgi:hypothetical protein